MQESSSIHSAGNGNELEHSGEVSTGHIRKWHTSHLLTFYGLDVSLVTNPNEKGDWNCGPAMPRKTRKWVRKSSSHFSHSENIK